MEKAFNDPYEMVNLLNEEWTHEERTFKVRDLFEENQLLMDLTMQPDNIKRKMIRTILDGMAQQKTFSYFHFMKFIGQYKLKKIAEQAELFVPMLSR